MIPAVLGFLFITIAGTLLHFVYEWSGGKKWVALIGAVNESTWEHMKIAVIPALVWSIIELLFFGYHPNFMAARLVAVVTILLAIPLLFYGYTWLTRKSILALDIGLFVVSIGLGQWLSALVLKSEPVPVGVTYTCLVLLIVLFAACMLLTLKPIRIFLFRDPINGKYGIDAFESH
jgi:hypothetical protein